MRSGRRSAALLPLLLAAACIVLGARVYDEWQLSQEPLRIDAPAPVAGAAPAPQSQAPLTAPSPGAFAAIVERPLFSPTRRPPQAPAAAPQAAAAPAPPPQPIGFSLAGIVIADGTRVALVQLQTDGSLVQVPEGGEVDGWKAVKIEAERAVFRRGGDEASLALDYLRPVPPGQVPPPVQQAPPQQQVPPGQAPPAGEQPQQEGNASSVNPPVDQDLQQGNESFVSPPPNQPAQQ